MTHSFTLFLNDDIPPLALKFNEFIHFLIFLLNVISKQRLQ